MSSSGQENLAPASQPHPQHQQQQQQQTQLSLDDFELLPDSPLQSQSSSLQACVQKVRRKSDGCVFVWKRINYGGLDSAEMKALLSELLVVRQIRHSNIVKYVGRIVDETKQHVYIVTEYCEHGDLASVIRKHREERKYIDEDKIWKWLTQLALALRCCHCRQGVKAVLHRDLKPANCFLDSQDNLKLGDFGLARVLRSSGSFASTFVGTPYYMSPEQMQKSSYTEKSDIWSLGIVAYELACLRPPFVAEKQRELASRIKRGEFDPLPDRYSPELHRLVSDCLTVRPELRPSVEELLRRTEMRERIPSDEAPEASLRSWAEQLREFADAVTRREEAARRAEFRARRDAEAVKAELRAWQGRLEERERKLAEAEALLKAPPNSFAATKSDAATNTEAISISPTPVVSTRRRPPRPRPVPDSQQEQAAPESPGQHAQKSVSFASGPPEVRPVPAPRRSVLRDQANCTGAGSSSWSHLQLQQLHQRLQQFQLNSPELPQEGSDASGPRLERARSASALLLQGTSS